MSATILYSECPACKSVVINKALVCKDYTVSNELFEVWECSNCTLRFTQNAPGANAIAPYYQSAGYVSHSNTKEGAVNRLYHLVRNYTLKAKRNLVSRETSKTNSSLLDVGAGTGSFAHIMQQAKWQVTGLEPDETARTNALKNYGLQLDTLETLYRLPANSFDAITLWHVLEHVHELHLYLDTFHKLLKSDGTLFIAVPNYTSKDAEEYGKYWAAYDIPRHLYHFSPQSMKMLLEAKGFEVKKLQPMWFDSFYISILSEQYKYGKGNMLLAFWNGLLSNLKALRDKSKCSSLIYIIKRKTAEK